MDKITPLLVDFLIALIGTAIVFLGVWKQKLNKQLLEAQKTTLENQKASTEMIKSDREIKLTELARQQREHFLGLAELAANRAILAADRMKIKEGISGSQASTEALRMFKEEFPDAKFTDEEADAFIQKQLANPGLAENRMKLLNIEMNRTTLKRNMSIVKPASPIVSINKKPGNS